MYIDNVGQQAYIQNTLEGILLIKHFENSFCVKPLYLFESCYYPSTRKLRVLLEKEC